MLTTDAPDTAEQSGAQAPADHSTVFCRQAIVDRRRQVFGYELFNRFSPEGQHSGTSDTPLLVNVLTHGGAEALVGRKTVFMHCSHEALTSDLLELIPPDRVVLQVPPIRGHSQMDIEIKSFRIAHLRKKGFQFAFDQSVLTTPYAAWQPLATYIKLDLRQVRQEFIEPLVHRAERCDHARLVAEHVDSVEQYEAMQGLGVHLFEGDWFSQPTLHKAQVVRPAQTTIIKLINLVRNGAELVEIENLLKKDPALSFNLLRFINSTGFGLSCEVTSFRHAAMILGQKKLFRWAVMLLTAARDGGTPPALGSMAIVRGRLMELLASTLMTPEECDNAFVVGVFSLLDAMLGMPMDEALATLALPESVTEALLHRTGEFAPFLDLTIACERGDDADFARAANALQLSNRQVNSAHLQALAWADVLFE